MSSKEQFIQNLSDQLKPVKRLASAEKRTLFWSSITFVLVLAAMSAMGPFRGGFASQLGFNRHNAC